MYESPRLRSLELGVHLRPPRRMGQLGGVALAMVTVVMAMSSAPPTSSQPLPAGVSVTITDVGFQPATVTILSGQAIHWTNQTSAVHSVTNSAGLFDSGGLPPGAGFSMALAIPGDHEFHSSSNPSFAGVVRVAGVGLSGAPGDLARSHIPDQPFPGPSASDISLHPSLGVLASRTRIIVGFTSTATVAQANAALSSAGVGVIGGLPRTGILLAAVPDTSDFSALAAAQRALLSDPAVAFAALSPRVTLAALPAPAEAAMLAPPVEWAWDGGHATDGEPFGFGGNWGLEASRFPEAWNLLEAIRRRNADVHTVILDGGFVQHLDVPLEIERLCRNPVCTENSGNEHGTGVAGIIGANFDNRVAGRSMGIDGANPAARMHGVPSGAGEDVTLDFVFEVFDMVLEAVETGTLPGVRVVNFSISTGSFHAVDANGDLLWTQTFPNRSCGPGSAPDLAPSLDSPLLEYCTPDNANEWLDVLAQLGRAARAIAERAALQEIIIVQSAGNDSELFCIPPTAIPCPSFATIRAVNVAPFAWAAANWQAASPNPIIVAEAINPIPSRAGFSNIGGHLSAPGDQTVSTILGVPPYGPFVGTSAAAPYVTGLIGYLLAYAPGLTAEQARTAVLLWTRADVPNGAARLDAFASLLSLPGAARALVDVNDMSRDGNRRVVLGPGGVEVGVDRQFSTSPDFLTEPDGRVDMRDFRRFRDAWLAFCLETQQAECLGFTPQGIFLNGSADHPKRDLNFDGCVHGPNCPTEEAQYPRFDFNGDGIISREVAPELIPLRANGSPAADPGQATFMTDLDVLASQWEADSRLTEGWTAADLFDLMLSGDIEVRAEDMLRFGTGQTTNPIEVTVRRLDTGGGLPAGQIPTQGSPAERFIIVTAPITPPSTTIEVRASSTLGTERLESLPKEVTLRAGEDVRIDLCAARLRLDASQLRLPPNGSAQAAVRATLETCPADAALVAGRAVTFSLASAGPGHASLAPAAGQTDAGGQATTTFTAGTAAQDYMLTAAVDLSGGRQAQASITISTLMPAIHYAWQQTLLDWSQQGTTRYGLNDPALPGCTDLMIFARYCVDAFEAHPNSLLPPTMLQRNGVLSIPPGGSGYVLDEDVADSSNVLSFQESVTFPDLPGDFLDVTGTVTWEMASIDRSRRNQPLGPDFQLTDGPDGLRVSGLRAVAELDHAYLTTVAWATLGPGGRAGSGVGAGDADALLVPINGIRPDFLLAARGDGSACSTRWT